MKLAINARFRSRPITGVERYAWEVASRLPGDCCYLEPKQSLVGIKGHAWEQLILPSRFQSDVLWSPCNTGPLLVRKQVLTLHDCAFFDHPECFSKMFAYWYNWLLPRLARNVSQIITVSEFSKTRILESLRLAPEKISVIPNGVQTSFARQNAEQMSAVREKFQLPVRYLLTVSSREPRKNLARLLSAWKLVAEKHSDVYLVIVGASNLRTFRDVGLDDDIPRVIRTGYVTDNDLPAIYSAAELFVYPSLYEGFGLPVLEAMACGTPVICSGTTSLPEVAGNAACLIDPLQVESLSHAIDNLLGNTTEQAKLREAGNARAKQFNWVTTASLTHSVLLAAK